MNRVRCSDAAAMLSDARPLCRPDRLHNAGLAAVWLNPSTAMHANNGSEEKRAKISFVINNTQSFFSLFDLGFACCEWVLYFDCVDWNFISQRSNQSTRMNWISSVFSEEKKDLQNSFAWQCDSLEKRPIRFLPTLNVVNHFRNSLIKWWKKDRKHTKKCVRLELHKQNIPIYQDLEDRPLP